MAAPLGAAAMDWLAPLVPAGLSTQDWVIAAAIPGVLHILFGALGQTTLMQLFKPTTMLVIIAMCAAGRPSPACLEQSFDGSQEQQLAYQRSILVGLLFSIVGDVCLMLRNQQFVAGLASFLVAHLIYTQAFSQPAVAIPLQFAAGLLAFGAVMLAVLWPGLADMKLPVIFYILAIMTMLAYATGRFLQTQPQATGDDQASPLAWSEHWNASCPGPFYAMVGAALFVVSDAALALDKFRKPFAGSQALVMVTYYSAQFLIALSVYH